MNVDTWTGGDIITLRSSKYDRSLSIIIPQNYLILNSEALKLFEIRYFGILFTYLFNRKSRSEETKVLLFCNI